MKGFLKNQNETSNDSYGMDYYEEKAKDLIEKYTQHHEHLKEKG